MEQAVRFGLVPVHSDLETQEAIETLAETLAEALGVRCEPVRCESPAALALGLNLGRLELAWCGPTLALTRLRGARPLVASVRQGFAYYHGVLFVRRDSDVRGLLDARGRSVAWVAETSAAGYLFPRVALASRGLDPDAFFGEERFHGSHGAVAEAVRAGAAEVGATFAVFEQGEASRPLLRAGFAEDPEASWARILFCTPAIPSDLVVGAAGAVDRFGVRLRDALLTLPRRCPDAVRRVTGAEDFMACRPRFLDGLRAQLEDARVLGLTIG